MNPKKLPGRVVILLSLTVLSILLWFRTADGPSGWQSVIGSDGRGYYAYLPAFITYRDPAFDSCVAIERALLKNPDYVPEYLVSDGTHTVNKYFIGVALLQLPFFIVATVIAWAADLPLTGYSMPFQVMAGLGAVFYLICGLWFLQRLSEKICFRRNGSSHSSWSHLRWGPIFSIIPSARR